jgi:2',3'-cyclic-nucleotide 2'-phosphodiesterase (5'-nucleotidase family)
MNLLNYDDHQDRLTDECGLAKTNTLIKAARAELKNSLCVHNRDLLQGTTPWVTSWPAARRCNPARCIRLTRC